MWHFVLIPLYKIPFHDVVKGRVGCNILFCTPLQILGESPGQSVRGLKMFSTTLASLAFLNSRQGTVWSGVYNSSSSNNKKLGGKIELVSFDGQLWPIRSFRVANDVAINVCVHKHTRAVPAIPPKWRLAPPEGDMWCVVKIWRQHELFI